jgi:hypothetical protein
VSSRYSEIDTCLKSGSLKNYSLERLNPDKCIQDHANNGRYKEYHRANNSRNKEQHRIMTVTRNKIEGIMTVTLQGRTWNLMENNMEKTMCESWYCSEFSVRRVQRFQSSSRR